MRGDRYGTVQKPRQYIAPTMVKVKLDKSGKTIAFAPYDLRKI